MTDKLFFGFNRLVLFMILATTFRVPEIVERV